MIGTYLADTNVFIRLLRKDAATQAKFSPLKGVCMGVHVLGELYSGVYWSKQAAKNVAEVTDLLNDTILLGSDRETADEYGRLKTALFRSGTPLPANDMWIAATALRHNLTLITYDAHFDAIPHLTKERW